MATYDRTRFWSSHNSYSGGTRRSLPEQLDQKVRGFELDLHDNDYDSVGDFRIGHLKAGHEVARGGGNPTSLLFRDWLDVFAKWSAKNPTHAPLTLVLDVKDDLTDNDKGGDPEDLNLSLEAAFGSRLLTREAWNEWGAWPDVELLRGKTLCVLSGHGDTRASYASCSGRTPSIAINAVGDTVLAYRSSAGDLRFWTGSADGDAARVVWSLKGTCAGGAYTTSEPAVAINEDGWVVSMYRTGPTTGAAEPAHLACRVGKLNPETRRINWFSSSPVTSGKHPSLEMVGDQIREIHSASSGTGRRLMTGVLDRQKRKVVWKKLRPTEAAPFPRDRVEWNTHEIRCSIDGGGLVVCSFNGSARRVAFRQVAFVERQKGDDPAFFANALFFAADAGSKKEIAQARKAGFVARAWSFRNGDQTARPSPPQENAPSTDTPFVPWYRSYMSGPDVDW